MFHPTTPAGSGSADPTNAPEHWDWHEQAIHSDSMTAVARVLHARGILKTSAQDILDELPANPGFPIGPSHTLDAVITRFFEEAIAGIPFVYEVRPDMKGLPDLVFYFRKLAISASTDVVAMAALRILREAIQPETPCSSPLQIWVYLTKKWLREAMSATGQSDMVDPTMHAGLHEHSVQLVSAAFGLIETSRLLRDKQLPEQMERLLHSTLRSWGITEARTAELLISRTRG
ncbi:hypothetical protein E3T43_13095 [Cryobacterium sp. Hh7]|uniref:hypothetical protein n=1 Tax=Cryobacterium sp. Hh7 TaxID=1259159 RepID=UPI00106CB25E|nr:hypothetical protein [Cryobacterium sp. Hh7]TFD54089.1 hypothetical protein E3T43_13095 [Cryobacterium sp. Hh7]